MRRGSCGCWSSPSALSHKWKMLISGNKPKYQDLVEAGCAVGFSADLLTVEIGSRGMVDDSTFAMLRSALKISQKDL